MLRHVIVLLICCVVSLVTGCNRENSTRLTTVSGVVKVNGQPAEGLTVYFEAPGGITSSGTTDESGRYQLNAPDGRKGAELGNHTVRIAGRQAGSEDSILAEMAAEKGKTIEELKRIPVIPGKYNENTKLSAQVQNGENTINFDLEI